MRFMGIDYGSKRIGIAISDETNTFALPKVVLENKKDILDDINTLICDNEVSVVIMGESTNFQGKDNKIMSDIRSFKEQLENTLSMTVILEPEFLTSHQAERFQGKNDKLDASAAALILQSYLDRLAQQNKDAHI